MDRPAPRPLSPFEKFVSAIAGVPKDEVEAQASQHEAERRAKRGQKPKTKPTV